jgi:hypothetical protein
MRAAAPVPDDPYLRIMLLGCAHEQKAHGLQWAESKHVGVANTNAATRFEAKWSQFFVKFD